MKKTTLSLAVACAMGLSAAANAYQFEVNAGFDRSQISNLDDDAWSIDGTMYLAPVDNSQGPLAEAAFLSKASFITLGYSYLDGDIAYDGDRYSIGGEYVVEGSNLILGARYTRFSLDGTDVFDAGNGNVYALTLGTYLNDMTTLRLNYEHQDWSDADINDISVSARHLMADMGNGMQVAVEGSLGWFEIDPDGTGSDSAWTAGVGADLYLNRQFSVGAGVDFAHGDNDVEGYGWDIRAQYFFAPEFAVNVAYGELNPDGLWAMGAQPAFGRTVKAWTLGLTGRF